MSLLLKRVTLVSPYPVLQSQVARSPWIHRPTTCLCLSMYPTNPRRIARRQQRSNPTRTTDHPLQQRQLHPKLAPRKPNTRRTVRCRASMPVRTRANAFWPGSSTPLNTRRSRSIRPRPVFMCYPRAWHWSHPVSSVILIRRIGITRRSGFKNCKYTRKRPGTKTSGPAKPAAIESKRFSRSS